MEILKLLESLHPGIRILAILAIAVISHLIVRELKSLTQWILAPKTEGDVSSRESFARRYPKLAGIITILVGAFTFFVYFVGVGLILKEFNAAPALGAFIFKDRFRPPVAHVLAWTLHASSSVLNCKFGSADF